jgi:flagellar basal body-associated protein FliL
MMPVLGSMGNVVTTIQEWFQVNIPVWHDQLARRNRWNTLWVFIGVLLVVTIVAAVGWAVWRGAHWLWGSHVRQIEKRINRANEKSKPTLDVEKLSKMNEEEREKEIKEFLCKF